MEKPNQVIPDLVIGTVLYDGEHKFDINKILLYAVSTGFSANPMDIGDLQFTYENHEHFKVLPTFGLVLRSITPVMESLERCPGMPVFKPMNLLHGEERLDVHNEFPLAGIVQSKATVTDVADKGKGALLTCVSEVTDSYTGIHYCTMTSNFYIKGIGGFGFKGNSKIAFPAPPARIPDALVV
jgi:hypothetical protein